MTPVLTALGLGLLMAGGGLHAPRLLRRLPAPQVDGGVPQGASYPELAERQRLGLLVAALTLPLVAGLVLSRWRDPTLLVAAVPLVPLGVLAGWVDLRTRTLSRWLVYPALAWVVACVLGSWAIGAPTQRVLVALGTGLVLRAVFWLSWFLLRSPGFGDVRLVAVLGVLLGWAGTGETLVGLSATFLLAGVGMPLLMWRGPHRGREQPFGPFLLLGTWVGLVVGEPVLTWYLG